MLVEWSHTAPHKYVCLGFAQEAWAGGCSGINMNIISNSPTACEEKTLPSESSGGQLDNFDPKDKTG